MRRFVISLAALLSSGSAHALTYVGSTSVGSLSASYTITTDGSTGVLNTGNITGFTYSITSPTQTQSGSSGNFLVVSGAGLTATPTQLLFDTTSFASALAFGNNDGAGTFSAICFTAVGSLCVGNPVPQIFIAANIFGSDFAFGPTEGTLLIGEASAMPAVPEPGVWAMMIVGFGAIGVTARRRRASRISFS